MPVTFSYPGIYVEEIATGARPIEGVGTSVAAFVGSAPRGPIDRAKRIAGFHEFVRDFGDLDARSFLGYSVQHFFANGGREAYIVRLASDNARVASLTLSGVLKVEARSPGVWGNDYSIEIRSCPDPNRFRLDVWHLPSSGQPVVVESFDDLSILAEDQRSVTTVLGSESSFVDAAVIGSPTRPPPNTPAGVPAPLVGGEDGDALLPNTPEFDRKLDPPTGPGGLSLLDRIDFDLLCVPGETNATAVAKIQQYCRDKRAFAIVDSVENTQLAAIQSGPDPALTGAEAVNSALYFPWVKCSDPLQENRPRNFPPSGFVAGIYARTDGSRGVWKAPAGSEAAIIGATGVALPLTDGEARILNSRGINCIRTLAGSGTVVWASRTLGTTSSEWKYVQVRRLFLFLEKSLSRGTRWAVFEPNDEPLWARIRLHVGAFMQDLFRQGAFQGTTPRDAYFVKCGNDTTTQNDVNRGAVNIVVGFAPMRPAEFVVIEIQQVACKPAKTEPAQHNVDSHRLDPYKNFKFRLKWEGRDVAGVSKVTRIYRAGGRDRMEYEALTLERGITYDSEFVKWASRVGKPGLDSQGPPGEFCKDVSIDFYRERGRFTLSCKVFRCWVSEFQGLPDLDANANGVAIQYLMLENDGWECGCASAG